MVSLTEFEGQFNQSDWERKLGSKRTKAGKYFWLLVLINYKKVMKGEISFDIRMVSEEYGKVFYRPYEAIHKMLTLYEGLPTATMREELNIKVLKDLFTIKS